MEIRKLMKALKNNLKKSLIKKMNHCKTLRKLIKVQTKKIE